MEEHEAMIFCHTVTLWLDSGMQFDPKQHLVCSIMFDAQSLYTANIIIYCTFSVGHCMDKAE